MRGSKIERTTIDRPMGPRTTREFSTRPRDDDLEHYDDDRVDDENVDDDATTHALPPRIKCVDVDIVETHDDVDDDDDDASHGIGLDK